MVPQLLWFLEKLVAAHFVVCAHVLFLGQSSPSGLIHVPDNATQESKVTPENKL